MKLNKNIINMMCFHQFPDVDFSPVFLSTKSREIDGNEKTAFTAVSLLVLAAKHYDRFSFRQPKVRPVELCRSEQH